MFKNILVPIDLDYPDVAGKAMEVAKEISRANGASLTVISVEPNMIGDTGRDRLQYQGKLDAFLAKHATAGEIKGVLEPSGSISSEIRAAARETGADLIVMSSQDSHFADSLVGSNAAHVAIYTPCSVMLVR